MSIKENTLYDQKIKSNGACVLCCTAHFPTKLGKQLIDDNMWQNSELL